MERDLKNKVLMAMGIGIAAAMVPVAGAQAAELDPDVVINDDDNDASNGITSVTADGETVEMGAPVTNEDGRISQQSDDGAKFVTTTTDHVEDKSGYDIVPEGTPGATLLQEKDYELEVGRVTKEAWTETIEHEEESHMEKVVDEEAWTETINHEAVKIGGASGGERA